MSELSQIHLRLKGMSGRAIRYRPLSASEVDAIEVAEERAIAGNKDTLVSEVRRNIAMTGLCSMIKAVSEPCTPEKLAGRPASEGVPEIAPAKWRSVDGMVLKLEFATLFNARDTAALVKLYHAEHSISADEVESLFAGKVSVLED